MLPHLTLSTLTTTGTSATLFHPQQSALHFPGGRLVVAVSGDFGSGKTCVLLGQLAATTGLPSVQKSIITNDLGGSGSVDATRVQELRGVKHSEIAACGCCDGLDELTGAVRGALIAKNATPIQTPGHFSLASTLVFRTPTIPLTSISSASTGLEIPTRFVCIELGGQTNGAQACESLKRSLKDQKDIRFVHVSIIDAESFDSRRARGDLTLAELNLETADVVVVSKSADRAKKERVREFLETTLSSRDRAQWPHIHYSDQAYLITKDLWRDIAVTPLVEERASLYSREETATREEKRKLLVRMCTSVNIPLYDELSSSIARSIEEALSQGADPAAALSTSLKNLVRQELLPTLARFEQKNDLTPGTLFSQILRIKGEFPIPSINKQFGIDIYLYPGESPTVIVTPRTRVTVTDAPSLSFYTNTGKRVPEWFGGLGIPVEFVKGAFRTMAAEYERSQQGEQSRLREGKKLTLRAEEDGRFEFLELVFLDVLESIVSGRTPNPYARAIPEAAGADSASDFVVKAFHSALIPYLKYRLDILDSIRASKEEGSYRESSEAQNAIFSLSLDLMTALGTHASWLLHDSYCSSHSDLAGLKARIMELKLGTLAVVEGLQYLTDLRIGGESKLTLENQTRIITAIKLGLIENQSSPNSQRAFISSARTAVDHVIQLATSRGYEGWDESSCRELRAACESIFTTGE